MKVLFKKTLNFIVRCGMNLSGKCKIGPKTKVRYAQIEPFVRIGENCNVQSSSIGSYSYLGDNCNIPQTKIGKFCSIATGANLAAGNHPSDYISTSPYTYSTIRWSFAAKCFYDREFAYINESERCLCEIGHDVWIGTGALLVASGRPLRIGNGAVIAAGAVVTKDVPAYAVVAGCPARVVRYRFNESIVERLEQFQWWNQNPTWLKENCHMFSDVESFLEHVEEENSCSF